MKHATMELGGKSPLIVFDDADIENAIGGAMLGNFYSTGQICSNGTRVFVQSGIHDRFVERLVERTEEDPHRRSARPGDPDGAAGLQGAAREGASAISRWARQEGATLLAGGGTCLAAGFRRRLLRRADGLHRRHRRHDASPARRFSGR